MVEYFHAGLDYYFITSRATEIALLDSVAAWARTGKSFNVYTTAQAGTAGLVRYYYDQIALANSRGSLSTLRFKPRRTFSHRSIQRMRRHRACR